MQRMPSSLEILGKTMCVCVGGGTTLLTGKNNLKIGVHCSLDLFL